MLWLLLTGAQAPAQPGRITQFELGLSETESPSDLLVGPEGDLWFTAFGDRAVGRLEPDGSVRLSTTGPEGAYPTSLTVGPEGDVWVGLHASDRSGPWIGRIGEDGEIARVAGLRSRTSPDEFAVDPRGAIWYASTSGSRPAIGRITPSGEVSQVDLPTYPNDIVVGPEGNAWFTMGTVFGVGSIHRASFQAGEITITNLPRGELGEDSLPEGLISGADGKLWFTDTGEETVGRVDTADGAIELMRPDAGIGRFDMALGPEGNLWMAGYGSLHRATPRGSIEHFRLPDLFLSHSRFPRDLVTGHEGRIWFTAYGEEIDGSVGWISTSGEIVELRDGLVEGSRPNEIVVDADGNLWFTDIQQSGMIGRVIPGDDTSSRDEPAEQGGGGSSAGPEGSPPPDAEDPVRLAPGRLAPARRVLGFGRPGRLVVPVACRGERPCVGHLVLRVRYRTRGRPGPARQRAIAAGRFRVPPRSWSRVVLGVNRYGRLRLRRAPRGRLGALLTVRGMKMRFGGFSRSRVRLVRARGMRRSSRPVGARDELRHAGGDPAGPIRWTP